MVHGSGIEILEEGRVSIIDQIAGNKGGGDGSRPGIRSGTPAIWAGRLERFLSNRRGVTFRNLLPVGEKR